MKYRKKPLTIEAIQFDGFNLATIISFLGKSLITMQENQNHEIRFLFETLEGVMAAVKGDWIIKGIQGEFYP
jgi:hypothetical protein